MQWFLLPVWPNPSQKWSESTSDSDDASVWNCKQKNSALDIRVSNLAALRNTSRCREKSLGAMSQSQQEVSHTEFKNLLMCTLTNPTKTFRQINMNNGDLTKCKLNSLVILNCKDFEFSWKVTVVWQISIIHHRTHLVQSVPNFTCWIGHAYVLILGHTVGNNHHLIYVKFKLFVPRLIYISVIYS